MANRRMFSKSITNSSNFLMMPISAQALYFHLGMNADDDGFCELFSIMRMTESKPDDLKILQAKQFVEIFDDKVLVILDWKENNYIQTDRYQPSKYLQIYNKELKKIAKQSQKSSIHNVYKKDTQVRIGQESLDQDRDRKENKISQAELAVRENIDESSVKKEEIDKLIEVFYLTVNPTINWGHKTSRKAASELIKKFGLDRTLKMAQYACEIQQSGDRFAPVINTPYLLKEKISQLVKYHNDHKNIGVREEAL